MAAGLLRRSPGAGSFRPLVLLLLALLPLRPALAEDGAPPFDPTLLAWSAGSGMTIPDPDHGEYASPPPWQLPKDFPASALRLDPPPVLVGMTEEATGRLQGGTVLTYEALALRADHIWFWQTPLLAPGARAWPQRVLLMPGEQGPEPGRVHLDSRHSALPSINLRGLLRPARITIDRQRVQSPDQVVVFHLLMEDIGHFRSEIRAANGEWHTITGRGDYLLIQLHADQLAGGLSEPRIASLSLLAALADQREGVELSYWHPRRPARIRSHEIRLDFDPQGQLSRLHTGNDTTVHGLAPGASIPDRPEYHPETIGDTP